MSDRIEVPPNLSGDEQQQLQQMWRYLYQLSEALNNNLQAIGGNDLTDDERKIMQKVIGEGAEQGMSEMETLKSLIIKTADFVQTSLNEYSLHLIGSSVAKGQFGKYVRNTKLDVAVNPEGITQKYKFQEVVQGLKTFSINAKNYIKTGLLRTVDNVPVYGVAIGKDVVTFDENGNETYVDGNKVAELTAEELSFWQNGVKIAGYTGSRISFYYGGVEVFYIQNGKLYAATDFEITTGKYFKVMLDSNESLILDAQGMRLHDEREPIDFQVSPYDKRKDDCIGMYYKINESGTKHNCEIILTLKCKKTDGTFIQKDLVFEAEIWNNEQGATTRIRKGSTGDNYSLGSRLSPFNAGYFLNVNNVQNIFGERGVGEIIIRPDDADTNGRGISIKHDGSDPKKLNITPTYYGYIEIEADVKGKIVPKTTTITDMNNLKEGGKYWLTFSQVTNGPSGLTAGTLEVEVSEFSSGFLNQRIYSYYEIYSRSYFNGAWTGWYKFTGTAV